MQLFQSAIYHFNNFYHLCDVAFPLQWTAYVPALAFRMRTDVALMSYYNWRSKETVNVAVEPRLVLEDSRKKYGFDHHGQRYRNYMCMVQNVGTMEDDNQDRSRPSYNARDFDDATP